jgi:glycosyltransferase involved in cell wall biosynthesis
MKEMPASPQAPKIIWLIHQYASTLETGFGGRHFYLARYLARLGHKVYVVAGSFTHQLQAPPLLTDDVLVENVEDFHFVWLKLPSYPQAHSRKRVLNWFRFNRMLARLPATLPEPPDAILYSSPALPAFIGASRLARQFKVPLTLDVRDLWPKTLVEIGGYSSHHPFIVFLQWLEDKAYRESDMVISNLENAIEHMRTRGLEASRFAWLPNGVSPEELESPEALAAHVRALLPEGKFVVGYVGTLGVANALGSLIEAAALLKDHDDIAFVLVGDGKEKNALQRQAELRGLDNTIFLDSIPKRQVQSLLASLDVCFLGWRDEALYQYGIGANKLPEYLASGRPVVHAYSGNCDPIRRAGAGLTVPAGNARAIAQAILDLKNMPASARAEMGGRGRTLAMEQYNYEILAAQLARLMLDRK